MDNKLKETLEQVTLPDDARARILTRCREELDQPERPRKRSRWPKQFAASAAAVLLALGVGMFTGPHIVAALAQDTVGERSLSPIGYEVGIHQAGRQGGSYRSESICCLAENGDQLVYWFQNDGADTCVVALYREGVFGDEEVDIISVPPGEKGGGTCAIQDGDTFWLRVNCVDEGMELLPVIGWVRMDQAHSP